MYLCMNAATTGICTANKLRPPTLFPTLFSLHHAPRARNLFILSIKYITENAKKEGRLDLKNLFWDPIRIFGFVKEPLLITKIVLH